MVGRQARLENGEWTVQLWYEGRGMGVGCGRCGRIAKPPETTTKGLNPRPRHREGDKEP